MGKYAVLLSAGPDRTGSALNGVEYALRLADGGHDVRVFLDGAATRWPEELATRTDHPLRDGLDRVVAGDVEIAACAYCAAAFDATTGCQTNEIPLLGTAGEEHGPDIAALVADGYELLTMS
ncbi:hypothetical protein EXE43_20115 [Halorubrum sp. SS5]|uniref:DsrE family protein n=1 Tax=Halorubrum salinarum TaxID=2739057 RepID=A0A7D3Y1Q2_9EURY|nr:MULTISPECIES: DsrE family protein [Halorubrum]QKG94254.1 DsrE family protein [Halorubrum salinarum]TKX57058.1 hypothetical protein EXE44_11630 [Halorubrum sp. SS7]TKX84217.1 hypothetical protein EXE43_20115 [Halorubrum sp. SS5]